MKKQLRKVLFTLLFMTLIITGMAFAEEAKSLDVTITCSDGDPGTKMRDKAYETISNFKAGDTVTIEFTEKAQGAYIVWGKPVKKWKLTAKSADGEAEMECGLNGYLHEYIDLTELDSSANGQVNSLTINFLEPGGICDVYIYGEGDLPDDVQIWEPSCSPDKPADLLVFSTHADDEILFLGGVLVEYAGQENLRTQLVYMTHYWSGPYMAPIREHEKLDGIWHCGVKQYPVNLSFEDLYCKTLDAALGLYKYDDILAEVTEKIRYFKPLIAVTQDFNGEYGHGGHMILAKAVAEASEKSKDESFCTDSANSYGTYDTPKTYFHLYKGDGVTAIELDLRKSLTAFGGKTGLEVAQEAYKKHVSQQWCWYYVSDDYEYSCDEFGLYRLGDGQKDDGSADMMNNLTSYEVVEEEERKKAQAEEEAKQAKLTEAARLTKAAEDAAKANEKNGKTEEDKNDKNASVTPAAKQENGTGKKNTALKVLLAVLIIAVIAGGIWVGRNLMLAEKRREEEELAKRKAAARARKKAREARQAEGSAGAEARVRKRPASEGEAVRIKRPESTGEVQRRPRSASAEGGANTAPVKKRRPLTDANGNPIRRPAGKTAGRPAEGSTAPVRRKRPPEDGAKAGRPVADDNGNIEE